MNRGSSSIWTINKDRTSRTMVDCLTPRVLESLNRNNRWSQFCEKDNALLCWSWSFLPACAKSSWTQWLKAPESKNPNASQELLWISAFPLSNLSLREGCTRTLSIQLWPFESKARAFSYYTPTDQKSNSGFLPSFFVEF